MSNLHPCTRRQKPCGHTREAEASLELGCLLFCARAHQSVSGPACSHRTALTVSKTCKKNDPTGRINRFGLSCGQILLRRCGCAASLAGKEQVWIAQGTAAPLLLVKEQNFLVTPDSATSLSIKGTWVASRLTRNGQQKDARPNCSAGDRGSEDQADPRTFMPSSLRCAASGASQAAGDCGRSLSSCALGNHDALGSGNTK